MSEALRLTKKDFASDQEVRVRVAEKQGGLVEGEAEGPDPRSAPEPGEYVLGHHGLHEKDEKGAGKARDGEEDHSGGGDQTRLPTLRHPAGPKRGTRSGSPRP